MKYYLILLSVLLISSVNAQEFVQVQDGQFIRNGKTYHYLGTNFWYGMNLGSNNKERLLRELDRLNQLGIKNLRIMAASEGDIDAPWRMQPSLQKEPGEYDEDLLMGLDFLLNEMKKRNMLAVVCLNNFWPWSGGFSQYVSWANNNEDIPFPPPADGGDWRSYQEYSAKFYKNEKAQEWFQNFIKILVSRRNSINGMMYKNDPTIMAWQLANEPEGVDNPHLYREWIFETAQFIKQLDSNHLVSIGSEGNTPSAKNGTNFFKDHNNPSIDYCTFHLWVQNWGWYDPEDARETYSKAILKASQYIIDHLKVAERLNKPIVLEEFGISRDDNNYESRSNISYRNDYYQFIFQSLLNYSQNIRQMSGVNFWAWAGEGRPREPKAIWKEGDDFIGDPPHEYQGWYSVYDTDISTLQILQDFTGKFNSLDTSLPDSSTNKLSK